MIICAETEKQEEWDDPDAGCKEGCNFGESGGRWRVAVVHSLTSLLRLMCKVEEPHEVVHDDKNAACKKRQRRERNQWPIA